jgi:hypothetical protein
LFSCSTSWREIWLFLCSTSWRHSTDIVF